MAHFNRNKYLRKMKLKKYGKYFYLGIIGILCFSLGVYFTYSKYNVSKEEEVVRTTVGNFISGDVVIGAYINGEYSKEIPRKSDGYIAEKVVCDNNAIGTWNYEEWSLTTKNITTRSKCNVYFIDGYSKNFDYTGGEQFFKAPISGIYRLEVWGAQGGKAASTSYQALGGYGSYASANIELTKDETLYLSIGGQGQKATESKAGKQVLGGYNGGGNGYQLYEETYAGGGGGATHIAKKSGLLNTLENIQNHVLIVASGGAGGYGYYAKWWNGNAGGGIIGGYSYDKTRAATQVSGYAFGQASDTTIDNGTNHSGGGGGYYGGFASWGEKGAGGGSGYIGNSSLTNKVMYCYNCSESSEENTKTISTTCSSETPTENCSKKGDGYARITLVSID